MVGWNAGLGPGTVQEGGIFGVFGAGGGSRAHFGWGRRQDPTAPLWRIVEKLCPDPDSDCKRKKRNHEKCHAKVVIGREPSRRSPLPIAITRAAPAPCASRPNTSSTASSNTCCPEACSGSATAGDEAPLGITPGRSTGPKASSGLNRVAPPDSHPTHKVAGYLPKAQSLSPNASKAKDKARSTGSFNPR